MATKKKSHQVTKKKTFHKSSQTTQKTEKPQATAPPTPAPDTQEPVAQKALLQPVEEVKPQETPPSTPESIPAPAQTNAQPVEKPQELESKEETMVQEALKPQQDVTQVSELSNESFDNPDEVEKKSKLPYFMIVFLLIGMVIGATGFFALSKLHILKPPKPSEEKTQAPTPTPTPEVKIQKKDITIEVLNGSTIPGAAARVAQKLQSLGYTVVKTGNADNSNYDSNKLYVSDSLKDSVKILLNDLGNDYSISATSGTITDSTASARLILGKNVAAAL